jgi:CheY-like chemotaxis protein
MRKANVLAVDDKPANLIALEAVLGSEFNLICVNSGAEAIETLQRRHDICTILMDLQMPEMDGFEAAARIKKLSGCEDIPIIFITAIYNEDPFIRKGYEAGAVDYFSKPFDPDILRKKVAIYSSFRQKAQFLKDREKQIRETEELIKTGRKLSAVLEGLPVGVLIADMYGEIFQINEIVSRIIKAVNLAEADSYGEILGWWNSGGRKIKEKKGPLYRALHLGEPSHNEAMEIQCADGTVKKILCSASPLLGLNGLIFGAVVVIQDLTESKQVEEDFEKRINKLVSIGLELEHAQSLV